MHMIERRDILRSLGWAGATALLSIGGIGRAAAATAVTATFGPSGPIYAPNMVAQLAGFGAKAGLDLKLQIPDGGVKARQILAAGEAEFGHGDTSHPLQLTNRGKACKILMGMETICSYANILVRQDLYDQGLSTVTKLSQWKRPGGAKPIVAATAIGSGTWLYGTYIFGKLGAKDAVNWVAGGGTSTMLGGLKEKHFDAIMALPSWQFDAEKNGWGKTIYDVRSEKDWNAAFGGSVPTGVVYAQKSTVDAKPELVQAYVDAMYQSMQWLKSHSIDEAFALVGPKYMGDYNPEAAKREFEYFKGAWNFAGGIDKAAYERGGRVFFREGTEIQPIPYEQVVDMRFVENARKKFG
jgi:NitT/TauT family transport system substrate-binding protein